MRTVAAFAAIGMAQASSPLLEQAVDHPGYAMWSDSGAPGLVIGMVRGNDSFVEGSATFPYRRPPGADGPMLLLRRLGLC